MNVMNSPLDLRAHDDHLKNLLGQRAARADLHGRYPSLSEFSDSPSVYSHPHFSPRPPDRSIPDGTPHSFRFPPSPHLYSPTLSEPRSPISDRERLNIPNASSLDLEDDPRSSSELDSLRDDQGDEPEEPEEEELPRISMYGPKMRFHSPAPWEEDDVDDAKPIREEPFKRTKKKSDTGKKGWGLSRANQDPRPSNESSRSGSKGKQSFDAVSVHSGTGALAALAQASMSSTSLGIQQSPQSLRDKLSLPRMRSRTPSNVGNNDATDVSPVSRIGTPPRVESYADDHSPTRAGTPQHQYTHPYANPDLSPFVDHDLPPPSPSQTALGAIRSDSNATLTDTTPSSSLSQFRSTTTFSMTPGTSTTSVSPSLNDSTSSNRAVNKGISSPIPVDKTSLRPEALSKLHGYQQSPVTPVVGPSPVARKRDTMAMGGLSPWENGSALKLISLEEAQAQARQRARSQTAHPTISSPFAGPAKPLVMDTDLDAQPVQGRARSSSAGGKNRIIGDNPGDSPVSGPPRQVARKKSGFMRLFNGKERGPPNFHPPPVPTFSSDAFAANPPPPMPQYSRPRQITPHRVPVPSMSPTIGGGGSNSSGSPLESPPMSSIGSGSTSSTSSGMREQQQLTARRKVPELSIVTTSSSTNLTAKAPYTAPLSAGSSEMTHHHLTPTMPASRPEGWRSNGTSPSSAPPSKTDFVGLSIRPLSTLFTRELKELAVNDDISSRPRPSLEVDTSTPTTATTGTTAISPLSADFASVKGVDYGRSSDEKSGHIGYAYEDRDQSSVIHALQEQILSSRRAWQRQIWELEGQVRDLKTEVEELRATEDSSEYCITCGRGAVGRPSGDDAGNGRTLEGLKKAGVKVGGVVNRPRARTGVGSRFASGT